MAIISSIFKKASSALHSAISQLFALPNQGLGKEFEKLLIEADFGLKTSKKLLKHLPADREECVKKLEELSLEILLKCQKPLQLEPDRTSCLLLCGANGNGKTSTMGKLATFFRQQGKKVLIANCDTFRAGAEEQLNLIAQDAKVPVHTCNSQQPSAVAYSAGREATDAAYDLLIVDTSGRMSNSANLMKELDGINRSLVKAAPNIALFKVLVLDASTGQNAHRQVETFLNAVQINGMIITKLDGSAKAGVVVGIADKYELPIYFVSTGAKLEDLAPFEADWFSKNLFSS